MRRPTDVIADMLDARADDGTPLAIAEMRGLAAALRSIHVRSEEHFDRLVASVSAPVKIPVKDERQTAQIIHLRQGRVQ